MRERTSNQFPPFGQIHKVNGHSLHLITKGEGSPTVILEAGGASWSLDWHLVQEQVAKFSKVISYDRAGFGWSESGLGPRHAVKMVDELESLITVAKLEPPYILVGASFGGHLVRLFASRHLDDVAGVILLDSRHEALDTRMPPAWKKVERSMASMQKGMLLLSRIGLLPLLGRISGDRALPPAAKKLPLALRDAYLAVGYQPKYFETNLAELSAIGESDSQLAQVVNLGEIPLVVIRHGVPDMFSAMPPDEANKAELIWQDLQGELLSLSTHARMIVAESSSHMIQLDQPEIVVEAIRQLFSDT